MFRPRRRSHWLLLGLVLLEGRLFATPQFVGEAQRIDRVLELVDRRLAPMLEVAANKYQPQTAIANGGQIAEQLKQTLAATR